MNNITETLKKLVAEKGLEILQQEQNLNSILADLHPNEKQFRYLVELSLRAEIPMKLISLQNESPSNRETQVLSLKHYFKEEYFLEDKAVKSVFDSWEEIFPCKKAAKPINTKSGKTAIKEMTSLEEIFTKCKADGHFNKFESIDAFRMHFKDEDSYKKLWGFLKSKDYKVVNFDDFLVRITGKKLQTKSAQNGLFDDLPEPAYGDLVIPDDEKRAFPYLLKLGTIKYGNYEVPLMFPFYGQNGFSFIVEDEDQKKSANQAIELLAFRLMSSIPDGKCKLYIVDPEKSGQSFSNLYGLDSRILEKEVWDDVHEITNGLQELKNEIPRIQSEILTTKYKDLRDYNEKVKHSRAQFRFILISSFPANFNSSSLEYLKGIIKNGSKSGIYVIMSFDITKKLSGIEEFAPQDYRGLMPEYDFINNKLNYIEEEKIFNEVFCITSISTEIPGNTETIKDHLNKSLDKVRQLKIDVIEKAGFWTKSASNGITIPIGLSVDNKVINLQLGDGKDVHHALIAGATGKGKTVLLHNIILNAAKLYSPDELQFILMDYKEGTEFNVYAEIPHLRVLTVSGEAEFGLSVFEYLKDEITRRGEKFKAAGATDFASYKKNQSERLPRIIVIMDEFQVLLDPKKRISSTISGMLDDITRRGRSFGINLLLSTQSLGEVDISQSTQSQLGLRIAFSLPEHDCMKILNVENDIPSNFTKAGEAVYNAAQGKKEGNLIFQAAFIDKGTIPNEVSALAAHSKTIFEKPFIFDGARDIAYEDNLQLMKGIREKSIKQNLLYANAYLGEPFYLSSDHAFIRVRKQQESNILLIGDDPGGAISVAWKTLHQLALQSNPDSRTIIFDLFPIDGGWMGKFDNLSKNKVQNIKIYTKPKSIDEVLSEIQDELNMRSEKDESKDRIILCIMNVSSVRDFRKLGYGDLSPTASKLSTILKEGPKYGIHSIIHFLNRKSFDDVFDRNIDDEFENKILLKGQNPCDYGTSIDDEVKKEYTAYAIHPKSKYEADKFKIYKP